MESKHKATDYSFYERLGMSDTHILHYMAMHGGHARTRGGVFTLYFFIYYSGKTLGVFFIILVSFVYTLLIVYFWLGREKELYLFDG